MWQEAFVVCALVGGLSGCGTWMHSDKQSVTIFTNPPETSVVIDNYLHLTAPGTVTLSRKDNHVAQANKDGYESISLKIHRTRSGGSSETFSAASLSFHRSASFTISTRAATIRLTTKYI